MQRGAVFGRYNADRQQQSRILGNQRAVRHTYRPERGIYRQQVTGNYIHHIDKDVGCHRTDRILHADEPPLERHQTERGRCRPDTHEEILAGKGCHLGRARHTRQDGSNKHPLYRPDKQCPRKGDADTLRKKPAALRCISASESLRRQPRCPHPQKAEIPVEQIKQHCADSNTTDSRSIGYMPHNSRIHQPDQRNGDIRQDTRQCQMKNATIQLRINN